MVVDLAIDAFVVVVVVVGCCCVAIGPISFLIPEVSSTDVVDIVIIIIRVMCVSIGARPSTVVRACVDRNTHTRTHTDTERK